MMYRIKLLLAVFIIYLAGNQVASTNPPANPSESLALSCLKLPPLWHGVLCLIAGRYEQTIAICDEVLRGSPSHQAAYAVRGYAHLFKKDEERQAIADFTEALRLAPDHAAIYVARAQARVWAKDYDSAIADCTHAIRIDPSYGEAYAWRGICYLDKRVTDKAIADYTLALRCAPSLSWARCGRGEAYRRRGESARALADLEEVLRADPNNEQAHFNRCTVYLINRHECDRVVAESSERIQSHPKEAMWFAIRGMAYMAKGETMKGLRDETTAASLKPGYFHLHSTWKDHSLKLRCSFGSTSNGSFPGEDDPDERIAACTKRLASDPNNVAAYWERAYAYGRKSEHKQAIADLDAVIRRDPLDAEAYRTRGNLHHALQVYSEALDDFAQAIRLDTGNADGYLSLSRVYGAMGKYGEALHDCTAALRLDPRIAAAHDLRGWLYTKRKDYSAALADYSEAIRLSPVSTDSYLGRAWTYAEIGKYAQAIDDYKKVLQLDPQNQGAQWGLGWQLATCPDAKLRDGKEAQEHATTLCEASKWKEPAHLGVFAAACAECGDFDQAIKWQTRARELAPEREKTKYRQRLDLYRSHRPYHKTAAASASVPFSE